MASTVDIGERLRDRTAPAPRREPDARLVMVMDPNPDTGATLAHVLRSVSDTEVVPVGSPGEVHGLIDDERLAAVVVNHHREDPNSLLQCMLVKQHRDDVPVLVVTGPGAAREAVEEWRDRYGSVDEIAEKPLKPLDVGRWMSRILSTGETVRTLRQDVRALSKLTPAGLRASDLRTARVGDGELTEATIMFTDVRDSTQLLASMPPKAFLDRLNKWLSQQTEIVEGHEGVVIKYTGDGLLALFRGIARTHLGIRAALAIQSKIFSERGIPSGIGISDGLVVAGFIGGGTRIAYDVVGANVNLAARLCALANPGDILMSEELQASAQLSHVAPVAAGKVQVRGFDRAIECLSIPFKGRAG